MRATFNVDPSWLLFSVHRKCSCAICLKFTFYLSPITHKTPPKHAGSGGGDEYAAPHSRLSSYRLLLIRGIDTNAGDRQVGRRAQLSNITAAKTYGMPLIYYIVYVSPLVLTHSTALPTLFGHVSDPRPC